MLDIVIVQVDAWKVQRVAIFLFHEEEGKQKSCQGGESCQDDHHQEGQKDSHESSVLHAQDAEDEEESQIPEEVSRETRQDGQVPGHTVPSHHGVGNEESQIPEE